MKLIVSVYLFLFFSAVFLVKFEYKEQGFVVKLCDLYGRRMNVAVVAKGVETNAGGWSSLFNVWSGVATTRLLWQKLTGFYYTFGYDNQDNKGYNR